MEKKRNIFEEIVTGIVFVILCILLAINISVIVQAKANPDKIPSILGYKPFVVLSGSMEPGIDVGDVVVVKDVDPSELQVNDIISFLDSKDTVTTHRIIDTIKVDDDTYFKTKGDNNNTEDKDIVSPQSVQGIYQFKIAKMGNVIMFIQEPTGFALVMMTILVICILIYLFQSKRINKKSLIEDEEERKQFEEFKKAKELQKAKELEEPKELDEPKGND